MLIVKGQRFGRLTVLSEYREKGKRRLQCRCDCGQLVYPCKDNVVSGGTSSCGCLKREVTGQLKLKHGQARAGNLSLTYRSWMYMIHRCYYLNPYRSNYYQKNNILVCDEWRNSFEAFFRDMGLRPSSKHSIDRIKNNMGYEPGNVRWATPEEQRKNKVILKGKLHPSWGNHLNNYQKHIKKIKRLQNIQKGSSAIQIHRFPDPNEDIRGIN